MRHYLTAAAITTAVTLSSCFRAEVSDTDTSDTSTTSTNTKSVQFVVKGITEEYSTKATLASANITDLWVIEGNTLLKHQTSTDSDFGTPTLSLSYGAHDLTFIASAADGQSVTESAVWTCTKLKDTFASVMSVTVNSTSSKSRQVQLTRRIAKVQFTTTDPVPATVSKVHIKAASHKSLTASLQGTDAYDYEATSSLTAKQGSVLSNFVNVLPESPDTEEDCPFLIEFLAADDTPLYQYQRTLRVKPNRCTNLTGEFFQGESAVLSISADWSTALDVPLFTAD